MNKILVIVCFATALGMMLVTLPEGVAAIFLTVLCSFVAIFLIRRAGDENGFLVNIFLMGLILRLIFGTVVHVFELREFFGSDALAYDFLGNRAVEVWRGEIASNDWVSQWATRTDGAGWGMNYLTAFIYFIFGRNFLAAQSFCAVIGAATAPMVYVCAHKIFHNNRVSKISAILVAFSPSFIIWSAQLLKDGLVIFLLVLAITMVLKLQEKLNYSAVILLVLSMFGIIALRFYIFYMVAIAVVGSFVIGTSSSVKSIVRGFAALVIIGVALTYMGVLRSAGTEFERFGSLERIQISRGELATAESGYGEDVDVSTVEGALAAFPIGFMYLMFAPFPWQITNFRQAITLPEMMIWWSLMPLLVTGLWYTIKNRLRQSISILIFTVLLTLAYSVFQGNVGTAYRQRAQIQVFLFIFIAVGWTLWQERKENRLMARKNH